jgi:hypothetical protein
MNNINRKLRWLLMVLPLAGCASNVPLDMTSSTDMTLTKVVSVKAPLAMSNEIKNVNETKKTETVTHQVAEQPQGTTAPVVAPPVNPLDRPGDLKALAQPKNVVSKPVNIDPNVKLIAPPVGLPATNYAVPKVEEKEDYVPRASAPTPSPSVKTTTCTKGKNGKKVCKTSVKSEAKSKKGSASAKATKSSAKTSAKSANKKASGSAKKKTNSSPKKK